MYVLFEVSVCNSLFDDRELSAVNIDLQQRLSDIQSTLLEVAKVPAAERKQIVREVLLDRENEVSKSRREVRSLREQVGRLEMALKNPRHHQESSVSEGGEKPKEKKKSSRNSSNQRKHGYSHSSSSSNQQDSNAWRRLGYAGGPGESEDDDEGEESPTTRRMEGLREDGGSNSQKHLSKSDAMKIVVNELRHLQYKCSELEDDKSRLGQQVTRCI